MHSPLLWFATRAGLAITCLLTFLLLSGCSLLPKPNDRPTGPPEAYTEDTPVPVIFSDRLTNGELTVAVSTLRGSLTSCNADKAAIREWTFALPKE
jgi:hypothetical protein